MVPFLAAADRLLSFHLEEFPMKKEIVVMDNSRFIEILLGYRGIIN